MSAAVKLFLLERVKSRRSAAMSTTKARPEYRASMSAIVKARSDDPEYMARWRAANEAARARRRARLAAEKAAQDGASNDDD